jgi:flagellar hook-basal body complex protein FliE
MEPASLGAMRQYQLARQALTPDVGAGATGTTKAPAIEDGKGFAENVKAFSQVFENVENTTQAMANGQADAHSVVQAMAQAEVALETAVTIRNRVVEAYQELLRMPV